MLRVQRIRARVEASKGGSSGSVRRGYSHINKAWLEHATSKAIREFGAGRKWYFGAHQSYLKRWHDLERRRGHAIDRTDLKNEWIDQLIIDIKTLEASSEKFTEKEKKYVAEMRKKLHTLQHGEEKNVQGQMDLMCAKIGARLLAPSTCSEVSAKEEKFFAI